MKETQGVAVKMDRIRKCMGQIQGTGLSLERIEALEGFMQKQILSDGWRMERCLSG